MLRRRLQGKTNYRKRLALLKSRKARLVVRITNKNVITQAIESDSKGDRVIFSAHSRELIKYGWDNSRKNISAAYLTGYLLGKKAMGKSTGLISDLGLHDSKNNTKVYSVLKGAVDSGLDIKVKEEVFPKNERITGKHTGKEKMFEAVKKSIENGKRN